MTSSDVIMAKIKGVLNRRPHEKIGQRRVGFLKVKLVKHDEIPSIPIGHDLESAKEKETFYQWDVSGFLSTVRVMCLFISSVCKGSDFDRFGPGHPSESHVIHMTAQENQVRRDFSVPRRTSPLVCTNAETNWNI